MKKLLLFIFFVTEFSFDVSFAQTPVTPTFSTGSSSVPVPITTIIRPPVKKGGRSVELKPTVWFSYSMSAQVEVQFLSEDYCTMEIVDQGGSVVYSSDVITDGGRHAYFLPELDADLYTISIESQSATYEGEFYAS